MNTELSKRGISTVLTTIIILVASVVLASGVVLYGTSLFQGSALTESIVVSGAQVWIDPLANPDGHAWGATGVRNNGDKIISLNKIAVRGVDVPFTSWYATIDLSQATIENTQAAFPHSGTTYASTGTGEMLDSPVLTTAVPTGCTAANTADELIIDIDGTGAAVTMCLLKLNGPISLSPGDRTVVYFHIINNTLNPIDAGERTLVNISASEAGALRSIIVATTPP